MRELDDAVLELRLRGVLREHLGELPLDLTVAELDRRRESRSTARRRRRALIALGLAAALLLPLGVLVGGGTAAVGGARRARAIGNPGALAAPRGIRHGESVTRDRRPPRAPRRDEQGREHPAVVRERRPPWDPGRLLTTRGRLRGFAEGDPRRHLGSDLRASSG